MLIFGLAWVASWMSFSVSPVAAIQEAATIRLRGAVENPLNLQALVPQRSRSMEQAFRVLEDASSTQPPASQFTALFSPWTVSTSLESAPFVGHTASGHATAEHTAQTTKGSQIGFQPVAMAQPVVASSTLLPNWLNSQSSILTLAESFTRWLAAITPQRQPEETDGIVVPEEILSTDNLTCMASEESGADPVQYDDFSTWLRDCMLAGLPKTSRESLAVRIEETLSGANWQGQAIEPTLAENVPAARIGNRTLFIVTEEISHALGHNAEVVTTRWVNQLRLALGAAALPLVESQMKMYGLKPTGDFLSGEASWYGPYFQGRLTATGEIFDKAMFTAAHKTLPFDTFLKVTNLRTGNVLVVRINDRGPYVGDRILDLSQGSANYLGSPEIGVIPVTAEFLEQENPLQASLPYRAIQPSQDPLITMWRP